MNINRSPVDFAFLDSGTGGLPYMLHLKKLHPHMSCVYLADTLNFPYGEKTPDQINVCAAGAVARMLAHFAPKAVVIACNTISVTSLEYLRSVYAVPFVGTVPAVKLAASVSVNKKIGLLATRATVSHEYTDRLIRDFASDCDVFKRGDNLLVDFIEHHLFTASKHQKIEAVMPAVDFFLENGADTIILGCTHFIHLALEIQEYAGSNMHVVDSRDGVVRQAVRVWTAQPQFVNALILPGGNKDERLGVGNALILPSGNKDERLKFVGTGILPSGVPDSGLFISGTGKTGADGQSSTAEYEFIAASLGIPWCGILPSDA